MYYEIPGTMIVSWWQNTVWTIPLGAANTDTPRVLLSSRTVCFSRGSMGSDPSLPERWAAWKPHLGQPSTPKSPSPSLRPWPCSGPETRTKASAEQWPDQRPQQDNMYNNPTKVKASVYFYCTYTHTYMNSSCNKTSGNDRPTPTPFRTWILFGQIPGTTAVVNHSIGKYRQHRVQQQCPYHM